MKAPIASGCHKRGMKIVLGLPPFMPVTLTHVHAVVCVTFLLAGTWASRLCAAPPAFEHHIIDQQGPKEPWIKIVADLDGDGRPDVIVGGGHGPLVWYANPSWKKSVIATGGYDAVDGEAADVDGDGDLDLVIGGVLWYENPLPKAKPDSGPWVAHRIAQYRTHDVEVADLDGDGKPDVVVRDQSGFGSNAGNRVMLHRQRSPDDWAAHTIDCPHGEGLKVADLNRDGRPDIIISGRWYENPGRTGGPWREHVYAAGWGQENVKVAVGDFNRDGRLDIVLTPAEYKDGRYRIAWYEAPADPRQSSWKEHVIERRHRHDAPRQPAPGSQRVSQR